MSNKPDKYIYPAIFIKMNDDEGDYYNISFPDFQGCISQGNDLDDALCMAKEALELHLYSFECDNYPIPEPTNIEDIKTPPNSFTTLITANMKVTRLQMLDKPKIVNKNLTLPKWLEVEARQNNINFSKVLQDSLKDILGHKE